jgi:prevent-host-death family protein
MRFVRRVAQILGLDQVRSVRPVRRVRRVRPGGAARLAAYNTYDARTVLSQLLARVAAGEEIVIARSGVPVAKLVPYTGERVRPGLIKTHVYVVAGDDGAV